MNNNFSWLKLWNIAVIIITVLFLLFVSYRTLVNKVSFKNLFNFNEKGEVNNNNNNEEEEKEEEIPIPKPEPKLKIIDLDSKTRTVAVMIDNEPGAWPQAGTNEAYIIYEITVEGGQTRMLALFKDKDTIKIGPNRSARHYFTHYALENDAIFTHFGYSPQALEAIKKYGVNNISGTGSVDGKIFWREEPKSSYHNVFTTIGAIKTRAEAKGYRVTSDSEPLLKYSIPSLDLASKLDVKIANKVYIKYSSSHNVSYEYDSVNKVYLRSMRGKAHMERTTGKQLSFKNIIVYSVKNFNIGDGSSRQDIINIGTGNGYFISEGYAIPITWKKDAVNQRTSYYLSDGSALTVNDGNTFIQIQPLNQTLTIE